jgi:hypothetical protein
MPTLAAPQHSSKCDMSSAPSHYPVWLVHLALALGGFAIGTTEFATMSLLPLFSTGLGIDEPTAGNAPMPPAWWSAPRCSLSPARG